MGRSALIIEVPAAEAYVGGWRSLGDPAAAEGVPAHITVLYPFVPGPVPDAVVAIIATVAAEVEPFTLTLERCNRFPGGVLFLEPDAASAALVVRLTMATVERWPEHPPYGGRHADVHPHLTVIDREAAAEVGWPDATTPPIDLAEAVLTTGLPIVSRVRHLSLWETGPDGRWHRRAQFPLGGRGPIEGVAGVLVWTSAERFPAMAAFYRDLIGGPPRRDLDGFFSADWGGVRITITVHDGVTGPSRDPLRLMINLRTDDIAATHRRLVAAGVVFARPPEREDWGGIVATFADPDGNTLQLFG